MSKYRSIGSIDLVWRDRKVFEGKERKRDNRLKEYLTGFGLGTLGKNKECICTRLRDRLCSKSVQERFAIGIWWCRLFGQHMGSTDRRQSRRTGCHSVESWQFDMSTFVCRAHRACRNRSFHWSYHNWTVSHIQKWHRRLFD